MLQDCPLQEAAAEGGGVGGGLRIGIPRRVVHADLEAWKPGPGIRLRIHFRFKYYDSSSRVPGGGMGGVEGRWRQRDER